MRREISISHQRSLPSGIEKIQNNTVCEFHSGDLLNDSRPSISAEGVFPFGIRCPQWLTMGLPIIFFLGNSKLICRSRIRDSYSEGSKSLEFSQIWEFPIAWVFPPPANSVSVASPVSGSVNVHCDSTMMAPPNTLQKLKIHILATDPQVIHP